MRAQGCRGRSPIRTAELLLTAGKWEGLEGEHSQVFLLPLSVAPLTGEFRRPRVASSVQTNRDSCSSATTLCVPSTCCDVCDRCRGMLPVWISFPPTITVANNRDDFASFKGTQRTQETRSFESNSVFCIRPIVTSELQHFHSSSLLPSAVVVVVIKERTSSLPSGISWASIASQLICYCENLLSHSEQLTRNLMTEVTRPTADSFLRDSPAGHWIPSSQVHNIIPFVLFPCDGEQIVKKRITLSNIPLQLGGVFNWGTRSPTEKGLKPHQTFIFMFYKA